MAGSECAWQLAERGFKVRLYEMRSGTMTPAHKTNGLAELVCSNSFGSQTDYSAPGQLKWEAEALGSLILKAAKESAVPAGMSLSVDRDKFSQSITTALENHPNIEIRRELVSSLDQVERPTVIATGPLTHEPLAKSMQAHFDQEFLYFFDAIAPIIDADSINTEIVFKADRFGKGTKDYYNCPLERDQYFNLIEEIKNARKVESKEFEQTPYFDGCMPIEEMVRRGVETPRFGPMSPKGIRNPKNDKGYFAIVQLRQENLEATAYNMVGFQTKMAYGEQTRVFRMIPGLEEAEFLKLGSIHRNLYIHSPKKLTGTLSSQKDPDLYFAGQITGVEGYFESTCMGLLIANFMNDKYSGREISFPPRRSAFGSLLNALTEEKEHFQPTNINFSLFPKLEDFQVRNKKDKAAKKDQQLLLAKQALSEWIAKDKPWLARPSGF